MQEIFGFSVSLRMLAGVQSLMSAENEVGGNAREAVRNGFVILICMSLVVFGMQVQDPGFSEFSS